MKIAMWVQAHELFVQSSIIASEKDHVVSEGFLWIFSLLLVLDWPFWFLAHSLGTVA